MSDQHLKSPEDQTDNQWGHLSVMLPETIHHLDVQPGQIHIDATVGAGGHAWAILDASTPNGRLLAIDADPEALERSRRRLEPFGSRVSFVVSNFRQLETVAQANGFPRVDGILLDLGVSSLQLGNPDRGFSFQSEGPLDMRLNPSYGESAADLVNRAGEKELADILWRYGEERASRRIARAIIRHRPITRTVELAEIIANVMPRRGKIHPATRSFMGLRIAVNDELAVLTDVLPQAVRLLKPRGRLVVISFHSLEDRIVKRFFQREARDCVCPPELPICLCDHRAVVRIVTTKPIRPSTTEVRENPRSRSARLRVAERKTAEASNRHSDQEVS